MITVERLHDFNQDDAAGIGKLRPYLIEGAGDGPVDEALLRSIVESPDRVQLVARDEQRSRVVGAATLNIIVGAMAGKKGWLEDFVTDPTAGVRGIGQLVWNEMVEWCKENDVSLEFTSRPSRVAAHKFYLKQNAATRETTVFKYTPTDE